MFLPLYIISFRPFETLFLLILNNCLRIKFLTNSLIKYQFLCINVISCQFHIKEEVFSALHSSQLIIVNRLHPLSIIFSLWRCSLLFFRYRSIQNFSKVYVIWFAFKVSTLSFIDNIIMIILVLLILIQWLIFPYSKFSDWLLSLCSF